MSPNRTAASHTTGATDRVRRTERAAGRRGARPTIAVIGGGQLARMLHAAAIPLAIDLRFLVASLDEPITQVAPSWSLGAADDRGDLAALTRTCDALTIEHELVDPAVLAWLRSRGVAVHPSPETLATAIDKGTQRADLAALGVALPPWQVVRTADEAVDAAAELGWPLVLKAAHGGYDGRGVVIAPDEATARATVRPGERWVAEPFLDLDAELAVTVARDAAGRLVVYPAVQTFQEDGICREVVLPAGDGLPVAEAQAMAQLIAEGIDLVGVLSVELFVVEGRVLVNELAARPHNSAHLTIEASATSQFENHLRAVAGLPLGPTHAVRPAAAMVNLLAPNAFVDLHANLGRALEVPDVHVHLYGKAPRPGRKVGHVTALADDVATALDRARKATDLLLAPPASTGT